MVWVVFGHEEGALDMTALWVGIADGLRGYYARPESAGPHPAVLVFIEAFGVNGHF